LTRQATWQTTNSLGFKPLEALARQTAHRQNKQQRKTQQIRKGSTAVSFDQNTFAVVGASAAPTTPAAACATPIDQCIRDNLRAYLRDLQGTEPTALYDMVLAAVERPLLEVVMHHANHNQSRAADMLGLNRNTLRKKLLDHGLAK
jgi:Fis family transcriptional regulator, factor for inversion stimulation protein